MSKKELQVSNKWVKLFKTKTWIDILEQTAQRNPNGEAVVFEDERVSYCRWRRGGIEGGRI